MIRQNINGNVHVYAQLGAHIILSVCLEGSLASSMGLARCTSRGLRRHPIRTHRMYAGVASLVTLLHL